MGTTWVGWLLSGIAALGGLAGLGSLLSIIVQRGKFKADATDVLTDTALALTDPLKIRVRELNDEADQLRRTLRQTIAELDVILRVVHRIRMEVSEPVVDPSSVLLRVRSLVGEVGAGPNGRGES